MKPKGVVVSNGCHRFHMYQAALVYEQEGLLRRLITGWYLKNPALISLLQSPLFTRVAGANLVKRLRSRRQEGLAPERVVSLGIPDLIERVGRSRLEKLFQPGLLSYCSMRAFGRLSRNYLEGASLFHVRSGYGRGAMARAKQQGAVCLVDHSIADPIFTAEILQEEASRWRLPNTFPHWHWRCVSLDLDEADHLLVNSPFVRDTLVACRGLPAQRITVLPLSVDLARFSPATASGRRPGAFRILFVGEIGLRKGVLYLLEAFKRLKLTQAELVLIGGITDIGERLAQSDVKFSHIPVMPHEDLVPYLQNSSVFVFPSLVEGSARVIQEAEACGLPVITTPNSGSFIKDGEDGYLVPIRDVDALAERLLELYNHSERRAAMGIAARRTAEREFTPQRYHDGLMDLYKKLCHLK
ncbi:MAG: glycosyltransferase [Desulfobaccales bacterium]